MTNSSSVISYQLSVIRKLTSWFSVCIFRSNVTKPRGLYDIITRQSRAIAENRLSVISYQLSAEKPLVSGSRITYWRVSAFIFYFLFDKKQKKRVGVLFGKWLIVFTVYCLLITDNCTAQERCATMRRDSLAAVKYKSWVLQRKVLEDSVQVIQNRNRLAGRNARIGAVCDVVRIPVVVHIVHDNTAGTIGGINNANVSDAQVLNQIRVLNEDYRRKPNTKGFNNNAVGADLQIEFFLATADPNGKPTNGITRHYYTDQHSFDIYSDETVLANIVSWPSDRYLNIWVVRASSTSYLGVAQFPSVSGIAGLDNSSELQDKVDGAIIDFRAFGTGGAITTKLYYLGRTATHEIGHWLGLLHTWGDAFCGTDYCNDTPTCESGNQSANCGPKYSNCNGTRTRNMTENYMDYSPDSCMNVFTVNQSERIRAVLEASPRRAKLVRLACTQVAYSSSFQIEVYPNPTPNDLNVKVILTEFGDFDIELFAMTGQRIYAASYKGYPSWIAAIPTTDIANGEYVLRVSTANESINKRVILCR